MDGMIGTVLLDTAAASSRARAFRDHAADSDHLAALLRAAGRERDMLSAIVTGEHFHLVYQPIVRLDDRRLQHYEALLRLSPGADGTVADTQAFTARIETLGLSKVLDLAVVARVLSVLRTYPDIRIAVNISGASLQSAAFREALLAQLPHGTGMIVEITETAEITDMRAAAKTLRLLRARGVRVCIDDFGTGHATFRYLRDLPVDCLKIDGSYVRSAPHSTRDREIIAAMCAMAGAFNVEVVAEQVEDDAQARLMMQLGVVYGQGWLLGRPQQQPHEH